MDQNIYGLAKLLVRGRKISSEYEVTFESYEKDDVLACDFFKTVVRPLKYTAERKSQFANLLVYKAKHVRKHFPGNADKSDERYLSALEDLQKVIAKFLRTYPQRYKQVTTSNA